MSDLERMSGADLFESCQIDPSRNYSCRLPKFEQYKAELLRRLSRLEALEQAAITILAQFETMQKMQQQLLCHGMKEAEENWDEATQYSIDFEPLKKLFDPPAERGTG